MLWIWTLKPDFGFNCCQASESRQIANFFDLLYILIGKMGKIIFVFNEVTMYVICQLPGQMLLWNVYFHEKKISRNKSEKHLCWYSPVQNNTVSYIK